MDLCLDAPDIEAKQLMDVVERLACHFQSVTMRSDRKSENPRKSEILPLKLRIVREQLPSPYTVHAEHGVTVSTWQSDGICRYAGISQDQYIVLSSLLGILQWRTLESNPLLIMEDLIHPASSNCLFMMPGKIHEFVLLLEDPRVCGGCIDFYHCLGVDRELVAVMDTLKTMRESPNNACSPEFPAQ